MNALLKFTCFAALFALLPMGGISAQGKDGKSTVAAFSFSDVKYFHRYTINDQHEYTPDGQEDLKAWSDMLTIHYYRKVKDGEALAATANTVLGNYKAHKGVVIKTDSMPRTNTKPAEYLMVVVLGQPTFLEAVFSRFKIHNGMGAGAIYSHRIYGKEVGNQMSAWLKQNGPAIEKNLMQWDAIPKVP